MSVIIKAENISKAYQLGQIGTGTLSRDIERMYAKIRGKEDPFLKIGESNDRSTKGTSDIVWSLRDINFEIQQGDAVGIIGRNGAGKSTLLKILSRITSPTTGKIKINGRVASLLEVGTGFHPELSGRENIYLNGAILGMRKAEIKRKFDEIVDFAGVERYIDTPVKRYSSGMYVRLAFGVAAHLESEILIVDEVLAVGDAEFQKKCLNKMSDVSKGEGRTVLFVSHNVGAIQKLCKQAMLLRQGRLIDIGSTDRIVSAYTQDGNDIASTYIIENNYSSDQIAYVTKLTIQDKNGKLINEIPIGDSWHIKVDFTVLHPIKGLVVGLGMMNSLEVAVRTSWNLPQDFLPGNYTANFVEEKISFSQGRYRLLIGLSIGNASIQYIDKEIYMYISDIIGYQEESVINNSNGVLINQMKMYVEDSKN